MFKESSAIATRYYNPFHCFSTFWLRSSVRTPDIEQKPRNNRAPQKTSSVMEHMSSSPIYREGMQDTGGVKPVAKKLTPSRVAARMETEARPFRCRCCILLNILFL